jgi:hypothetical protein
MQSSLVLLNKTWIMNAQVAAFNPIYWVREENS